MSAALLDNATLTGVQRILGQATSRSRDSVDVDLVAYENFVQARLFYDDVAVIDDYLPAHRASRRAALPQVTFIDPAPLKLDEVSATADAVAATIRPKIQGGDFANPEFRALFDLLQAHMVCTWDITSSIYHLTLKVVSAVAAVALSASALVGAVQAEFCAGFVEGYKSVKGDMAVVPACPAAPPTPVGSTPFREGLKAGIRAAQGE
jgi:hypothetical protein